MGMTRTWIAILAEEAAKSGKAAVAQKIGYSRSAVTAALNGNYPGDTKHIAEAVIDTFTDGIVCPFLGTAISRETCIDHHTAPIPQGNAAQLRHWRACRSCPHRSAESEVRHAG